MRALAVVLLFSVTACGSHSHIVDLGDDAGVEDMAACATIALGAAPTVVPDVSDDTAPTAQGGTIVDGTYFLTADTLFESVDMGTAFTPPLRSILQLTGTQFAEAFEVNDSTSIDSGTFTISGTQIALSSCQNQPLVTEPFSATASTFSLFEESVAGVVGVSVYTKQ